MACINACSRTNACKHARTHALAAYLLRSGAELKTAVNTCLRLFPKGDCSNGPPGAMGEWDVSRVRDMSRIFASAKLFNSDISKWDVSRVRDVSGMFQGAASFNGDLSGWDVSRVINMNDMFQGAASFKHKLCGAPWVRTRATKKGMFAGSSGSISRTLCTTTRAAFSPRSKNALKAALSDSCSDGV